MVTTDKPAGAGKKKRKAKLITEWKLIGDYIAQSPALAEAASAETTNATATAPAAKPEKVKKAKPPKKAKPTKEAKAEAIQGKLDELTNANDAYRTSVIEWEEAHAHAAELKKTMEKRQAQINSIANDLEQIQKGNFTPTLPGFGESLQPTHPVAQPAAQAPAAAKAEPVTEAKPQITRFPALANRFNRLIRLLETVKSRNAKLEKGIVVNFEEVNGVTHAIVPITGTRIKLKPGQFTLIKAGEIAEAKAEEPGKELWRKFAISKIKGMTKSLAETFAKAGLHTIGDVLDLESKREHLDQQPGIGPGKAAKYAELMVDFWAEHPEYTVA